RCATKQKRKPRLARMSRRKRGACKTGGPGAPPVYATGGVWRKKTRRRPTLPHRLPGKTIGSEKLNFPGRGGIGGKLFDITPGNLGFAPAPGDSPKQTTSVLLLC